jgi:hypothetical protein
MGLLVSKSSGNGVEIIYKEIPGVSVRVSAVITAVVIVNGGGLLTRLILCYSCYGGVDEATQDYMVEIYARCQSYSIMAVW